MTATTAVPAGARRDDRRDGRHWAFRIPVLGWIAHDVLVKGGDNIWYFPVILLCAEVLAIMAWGLPALVVSALALVPVMFVLLILISVGR